MLLENYTVRMMDVFPPEGLTGRRKILTSVEEITAANVVEVLDKALAVHMQNAMEINYLWRYYKGRQDICRKEKLVRENINNIVTVNRANEIVSFKSSYLLNEPVQYVSRGGDDEAVSKEIDRLNGFMREQDKDSKDKEIVDWFHICGVAERLVLPNVGPDRDIVPFSIYTLDPREAFVIYNAGVGRRPLAGVILQRDEKDEWYATIYTANKCFVVRKDSSVAVYPHILGGIPLIEYLNNAARMGAFEPVISILNNINVLESNAVDSVQDFVNGFDVFQNCDIEDNSYASLSIGGQALKIKTTVPGMEAKVYRVFSEISQSGVQTRIDDLTDAYLEICGMPNRNGGYSTSDTGVAVMFRDGWSAASSRAKDTATLFKRSERDFDRIVLRICEAKRRLNLKLSDFEPKFPFSNLTNIQSLTQTFTELLNNPKVHPHLAFEVGSALFRDPEEAYLMSAKYYQEQQAAQEESIRDAVERGAVEEDIVNEESV